MTLSRRITAEWLGTALLLAAVVGSGIMGERLAGGSAGLALLANSIATGAALVALILALGPLSGAHLNPLVTAAAWWQGTLAFRDALAYSAAQVTGAIAGVGAANAMFELPVISLSQHARHGAGQLLSESIATFGLLLVVRSCARLRDPTPVALAVGAYIAAAYWFTASTSFANPAVTIARSLSDTFAGIRPPDVPGFVVAQLVGAGVAVALGDWLSPPRTTVLFACVHNAGRSKLAEVFFNSLADPSLARAISAGTQPAARAHPEVVAALREVGITLDDAMPRLLSDEVARSANVLVTMGCGEECPVVPGLRRLDWNLADPKGAAPEQVRAIRDEIRARVLELIRANGWQRAG